MSNRTRHRPVFHSKETAGGNQQKEAIVLKPAQLAPDLMMKRFWASVDYPFNHFTEKLPIHHRAIGASKRQTNPNCTLSPEQSSPEPFAAEEETRFSRTSSRSAFSPANHNHPKNNPVFLPGDRVIFMESPVVPGVPVVYRTSEEKAANPDRLNLDRRRLTVCPILEGEEQLRLLNYQHNLIHKIQHVGCLKKLIFLDLYDNEIEEIQGIGCLKSLRVLMLGKNRIKKIQNLDSLSKLDVLDLHNNQINEIQNLTHLSELRVLNLAGNQLRHVDNLEGMDSLAELNLRRNRIHTVCDIDNLPSLQRLFLSFNEISSFDSISSLSDSTSLSEVSLDGNPIAIEQNYRQTLLHHMQQLRLLDMHRVSEDERRVALVIARKEEEKKREQRKIAIMKEKRRAAITNAKCQWEAIQGSMMSRSGKLSKIPDLYAQHVATYPSSNAQEALHCESLTTNASHLGSGNREETTVEESFVLHGKMEKQPQRPESAHSVHTDMSALTSASNSDPQIQKMDISKSSSAKTRNEQNKSTKETMIFRSTGKVASGMNDINNLAELDCNCLSLYGSASLEALDRNWGVQSAGMVNTVVFNFIDFDEIVKHVHKLRSRFPSLANLIFNSCNIHSFSQLNGLANLRRLDSLTIDSTNPVTKFTLWKPYLLFRLAHLSPKNINNEDVNASDIVEAEDLFSPLSSITSELTLSHLLFLLGESKKKQILSTLEDKSKKSSDLKLYAKTQEDLLARSTLTYSVSECNTGKQQKLLYKQRLAKNYVTEISKSILYADKKRTEVYKIWPQLFQELLMMAVRDMNDIHAYKKKWLENIEKSL